jgi:uncharacterized damage-inducible protein DinB
MTPLPQSKTPPADSQQAVGTESPHQREETTALPGLVQAICQVLDQGERLISDLTDEQYSKACPEVFDASIGAHFRHVLDHHDQLMAGMAGGEVDYDHRERDVTIETQRNVALKKIAEQRTQLVEVSGDQLAQPLKIVCCVSTETDAPHTDSSLGRELTFAISHAIHHYALIAVIAKLFGHQPHKEFGVAPSTLVYQQQQQQQQQ